MVIVSYKDLLETIWSKIFIKNVSCMDHDPYITEQDMIVFPTVRQELHAFLIYAYICTMCIILMNTTCLSDMNLLHM